MAKEAGTTAKKKTRPKRNSTRGNVKYCPNKSKTLNLSSTTSSRSLSDATVKHLRANNEELAKSRNELKEHCARLIKENSDLKQENMELQVNLRRVPDSTDVEAEVNRRVQEHMAKIRADIRVAIDHSIGLSSILSQLCVSTSSTNRSSSATSSSSLLGGRSSDIGGGRMRPVVSSGANTWSRAPQGSGSSPKQNTGTVKPMVAGHAISRPRIQLERVDLSTMAQVTNEGGEVAPHDGHSMNEDEEAIEESEVAPQVETEEELEHAETPPVMPPTRNVFDLTNIREESTIMDDSSLNSMEETLISPNMDPVQEENQEDLEDQQSDNIADSVERSVSSRHSRQLTSTVARTSVRLSLRPPPGDSASPPPVSTSRVDMQNLPSTSPYVLDGDTMTPIGFTRDNISAPGPSTRRAVSPNQSSSLSESILEQMMDIPMDEGPSWLFASVKKKKRKSSAVKKLSCIMSDLDSTAASQSATLDSSDLETSSTNVSVSGSVLDRDLRQSVAANQEEPQDETQDENQENIPIRGESASSSRPLPVPRTPLTNLMLTCPDDGGSEVRLKEARILLNNVGTPNSAEEDSPIIMLKRKKMTLDDLFSLGTRQDQTDEGSSSKRKFGSDSQVVESTKAPKKARTTDMAANAMLNVEVRLEKCGRTSSEASEDNVRLAAAEEGGRSRRQRSQVSYKEPAIGKKLRQGDVGSSSVYSGYKPSPKRKKKSAKK